MEEELPEFGLPRNLHDKALGGTKCEYLLVVDIVLYSTLGMIINGD